MIRASLRLDLVAATIEKHAFLSSGPSYCVEGIGRGEVHGEDLPGRDMNSDNAIRQIPHASILGLGGDDPISIRSNDNGPAKYAASKELGLLITFSDPETFFSL